MVNQLELVGMVLKTHVIPSVEVAAVVEGPVAIAQKTVPFQAMARQAALNGRVLKTHVMPSVDVAASAELLATAQKTVPFQAIASQAELDGSVLLIAVNSGTIAEVETVSVLSFRVMTLPAWANSSLGGTMNS